MCQQTKTGHVGLEGGVSPGGHKSQQGTVHWVLLLSAGSGWFWVDLKKEVGDLKGS